jgi:hypothetical protein
MTKRSWVQTPASNTRWMLVKQTKIKVAEWGKPEKKLFGLSTVAWDVHVNAMVDI